jgi:hypothetical protein
VERWDRERVSWRTVAGWGDRIERGCWRTVGGETGQTKVVGEPWVKRWDRERWSDRGWRDGTEREVSWRTVAGWRDRTEKGGWSTLGGEMGQREVVGGPWVERQDRERWLEHLGRRDRTCRERLLEDRGQDPTLLFKGVQGAGSIAYDVRGEDGLRFVLLHLLLGTSMVKHQVCV